MIITKILIIGRENPSRVSLMITLIVKKETSSSLKMELNIEVNGKTVSDTVKVYKFGLMEQSTKVTGKITKLTDKVYFGTSTAISMRETGREIKHMVMENTLIAMGPRTRVTGETIYSMEKVSNIGTITQSMRVNIKKERNMDKVLIHGKTVLSILANGMKIGSMVKDNTPGTMVDNIMVIGKTTIWMDMVCILGKMAGSTRANTRRIRSTALVCTPGLTVENTMVSG